MGAGKRVLPAAEACAVESQLEACFPELASRDAPSSGDCFRFVVEASESTSARLSKTGRGESRLFLTCC